MRLPISLSALLLVAVSAAPAEAQSDAQLWSEAGITHKYSDTIRLGFSQHVRLEDSASQLSALIPELGVTYRPMRWLRFGAGYRFAYTRDDGGDLVIRHRLQADSRGQLRRGPLRAHYRLRYQETIRGIDGGDGLRHTIRNRVGLAWAVNRDLRPAISAEIFHRLGRGNGAELRAFRLTVGTSYDWSSYEVDLFYRFETPFNDPGDPTLHIFGLGFSTQL